MKLHHLILLSIAAILLAACNFTLAEDVTPPPGYVPPTPAPTLGPLFPAQAPSTQNGAAIFAEKCAPCHGNTGLGDGPQGIQLGVTVPAIGLPEIARPASPAQWYTTVTQGNMERFMPPFASLSDQQRWDVVGYVMSLHMTEDQIAKGKQLFEANCANCSTDFFKDQSKMSALSEVELARIIKQGNEAVPAFGAKLSDDDIWAVAAYLRSVSFDMAPIASASAATATTQAVPGTESALPTEAATASTEGTPIGTEPAATTSEASGATTVANAGVGTVSGTIDNKTGKDLPADLKVTLHGYDHGSDPNAGPQEVFTQDAALNSNGSFAFENIELPLNRIFIAEIDYEGTNLRSGFAAVKQGDTSLTLPPIPIYNKTEDTSKLVIDEARIFFQYEADSIQVFNVYSFRNTGTDMVVVKLDQNGEIPFLKSPEGASGVGYEPMQDGETLLQTDNGFAIPPSDKAYGLIAFSSVPKANKLELTQEFVLPTATVTIYVPEGVKVISDQAADLGVQNVQNFNFQMYALDGVAAGKKVNLSISGTPKEGTSTTSSTTPEVSSKRNLLIGAGALGVALILAGGWMYWRDRNRASEDTDETNESAEFESAEDVMDAILALDDLHRAKKISDEAYQKRRTELKEILKGKM